MARPGLGEQEVWRAADTLLEIGAKVTNESVHLEVGHGSKNTVNKYLKTWREKQKEKLLSGGSIQAKSLKVKVAELNKMLETQADQNQALADQLLVEERKSFKLEQDNKQLVAEKSILQTELKNKKSETLTLQSILEALKEERAQTVRQLTEQLAMENEQSRKDMQAMNESNFEEFRKLGLSAQEALITERMKIKALQEQTVLLNSRVKELEALLEKEKNANVPFRKRLANQEKLIEHCLDPKKIEAYRQKSEIENV